MATGGYTPWAPCTDCPAGSEFGNLILAQHEEKAVAGIKVVLAIVHVEEIKRHPEEHPEIKMHGGPKGTHHLLIHLEDEKTGEIISEASVTVNTGKKNKHDRRYQGKRDRCK